MPRGVYKRELRQRSLGPRQTALIERMTNAESEWVPREFFQKSDMESVGGLIRRGLVETHVTLDDEDQPARKFYRYRKPGTPPGDFTKWLAGRIMAKYPENYDLPLHPEVVSMLERHLDLVGADPWLAAAYYAHEAATARGPSNRACRCQHEQV